MSWSLSLGGHVDTEASEAVVIQHINDMVGNVGGSWGSLSTQFHGNLTLNGEGKFVPVVSPSMETPDELAQDEPHLAAPTDPQEVPEGVTEPAGEGSADTSVEPTPEDNP